MKKRALILFAHGARAAQWAEPFRRLQELAQAQLPNDLVVLAFLEFMAPSLPELVPQLIQEGCEEVTLVPVFLGQAGHVLRDLPLIVEKLQKEYPQLVLKIASAAGEDASVLEAIAQYCVRSIGLQ
jgi:sirohydrochlorin cobaltochelatase